MTLLKKLSKSQKIRLAFLGLCIIPLIIYAQNNGQHKWTVYTGDPAFLTLADTIDKGRVIYHKDAQNFSAVAGNRGVLFTTTFVAFPSLNGSFSWSQVRINEGTLSFYPHIFTVDGGESTLSLAILYNIARVSPVRGVRTRPSFSPTSILQLEKEKMNFTRLKFVSEGFSTTLNLQTANQETELSLSDYEVNYTYWLKSRPNKKEADDLRAFFKRPLKSFKLRAYSDKGYLDTTLDGPKLVTLGDVFVKSIDLYERLVDPRSPLNRTPRQAPAQTNAAPKKPAAPAQTNAAPKKPAAPARTNAAPKKPAAPARTNAAPKKPAAKPAPKTQQVKKVTTNKRPQTTKVVKPK
ncbi:hypothetical protein SAMN02745150_00534 [Brevinema andersonii]|uniref:Uncharacterized protein n=1 Tax=Brevinema andersonii TaxID=34097 RepID=A0A1I1DNL7_BREAD|nr:hypothetical protein [Brevinema andersonii]SFB74260.1 hypothetical protein SAMN02745150_00534 [Brevinema andersonii]